MGVSCSKRVGSAETQDDFDEEDVNLDLNPKSDEVKEFLKKALADNEIFAGCAPLSSPDLPALSTALPPVQPATLGARASNRELSG